MKKELLVGIILLATIIIGLILFAPGLGGINPLVQNSTARGQILDPSASGSSDTAGRVSHNLVMQSSAANPSEESVLIYKTQPPDINKETTLALAKKFDVSGNLRGETTVQSKDLTYYVTVTKKSGSVSYRNQDRPNINMDSPDKLPSDDEAVLIATKFLKDRDLYPEGAMVTPPRREYTYSSNNVITYGRICVWFNRTLNGLKVEGTQLVVYVGGNGDVIGYLANWRNYTPYQEYPIIPQQDAFDQLKKQGIGVGMNEKDASVSIENAYLAYQTTPGAYAEDYLQPVWVFKGNVIVNGKSVEPVEEYIPALVETPDISSTATPTTIKTAATYNLTTASLTQTTSSLLINETEVPETAVITTLDTEGGGNETIVPITTLSITETPTETVTTNNIEITETTSPTIIPMESTNVTSEVTVNNSTAE